jgi:hypothetical protein
MPGVMSVFITIIIITQLPPILSPRSCDLSNLKCAGDLMHIKIFGLHIVIICNYDTASSLMSQASYSDRPILTMVGKLWVVFPP